jgi:hypothetical protein
MNPVWISPEGNFLRPMPPPAPEIDETPFQQMMRLAAASALAQSTPSKKETK